MRRILPLALGLALLAPLLPSAPLAPEAQEVTGLSGWSIFLDPGHSQNENVGFSNYSEARKVLRVGTALKEMLESRTDIDAVYTSRTNDAQSVSLSQRTDAANNSGADYFHSIHSNAAGPTTNYAFVLWAQLRNGNEPNPPYAGGRAMAEAMGPNFNEGMRIPIAGTNGGFGECDFYGESSCGSGVKGSRNFVQRNSLMPSTLSEAGFHTSTEQNPRNMNADWKVLEAQAMFWAILEYNGLPRTPDRILTGIITDGESDIPVNGATIEIDGRTYTTDTYESLFNQYSSDPDLLHNGFYYLPDMAAGTYTATITAPGYRTATAEVTMLEGEFTFLDVDIVSAIPPVVEATAPEADDPAYRITDNIEIDFSRPMDRAATEAAFSLVASGEGPTAGTFRWEDGDTRLVFDPADDLLAETAYTLTLAGSAVGTAGDALDGDGDGTGGDDFSLAFTSGFPDAIPPRIAAVYPANNSTGVERLPHLTLTYTEPLDASTVDGRVSLVPVEGGAARPGTVQYRRLGESAAISFFPDEPLEANTGYRLVVAPGLRDLFFNEQTLEQRLTFTTGPQTAVPTVMDAFEGDVREDWWEPQQSGSTIGIVTDSTSSVGTSEVASGLYGGSRSFRIDYGWNTNDPSWLIRQYRNLSPGGGARTFTASATLRAAVFGDGSGTLFRFAVRDQGSIEVSPWTPVDWVGWRDVTWDIDVDGTGSWISPDGVVDGNAYIDSIQLSYDSATPSAEFGQIWVDDLHLVDFVSTAGEETPEAAPLALGEAFPNPVRTRARVAFSLAAPTEVTAIVYSATGAEVARLASGETRAAGDHTLEWDASAVAAGVYFVRVMAAGETETARVTVVR